MKMTMKMKMKVEAARVSLVLAAVWFLLWSSSSVSAASMQCHFDSRGKNDSLKTKMKLRL